MADTDFMVALLRLQGFRAFQKLLYDCLAGVDCFADQHSYDDSASLGM